MLVDRLSTRFQDEKVKQAAIQTYQSVIKTEPEISEDGNVATYQLDGSVIKLSRMPNGKWGFHL